MNTADTREMLTRGFRLAAALGVACSAAALIAGWVLAPGAQFAPPAEVSSADVAGLSAPSNSAPTSVTEATPPGTRDSERTEPEPLHAHASGTPTEREDGKAEALLELMNGARAGEGVQLLERDPALDAVALARAQDLVALDYFEHYGPNGENAFDELRSRGIKYRIAGENLARNNHAEENSLNAAFRSLMASEGHRANIVEPRYSSVGVAAVASGKMWVYVTVFTS